MEQRTINLNRYNIISAVLIWLVFFMLLTYVPVTYSFLLGIVGFSFLLIVPGLLTVFLFKIKNISFWATIGMIVSFSLLELMLTVLLGNSILPHIGILNPLNSVPLFNQIVFLTVILLALIWKRKIVIDIHLKRFIVFNNYQDLILGFIPIIFVGLSIVGALKLNNGGTGTVTLVMLILIAGYLAILLYLREKIDENVIPTSLFFISLSLLFMISLRGWYITGHDILSEFHVFQLTKNAGVWNINTYKDAYNACMSITVLPTLFSVTLKFADHYVYKILFQIIFAILPSVLYLIIRQYTSRFIAFLGAIYFVAFPTFFNDMPMLNRQEIAFLFLGLMVYSIFETKLSLRLRRQLFVIFGFGMILSHYSTTYVVLALLFFLLVAWPIVNWFMKHVLHTHFLSNSGVDRDGSTSGATKNLITIWMLAVLVFGSFFWTSIVTDTSSGSLNRVVRETILAIKNNIRSDTQKDLSYSLFFWQAPDLTKKFNNYNEKFVPQERSKASLETYFSEALYTQYPIVMAKEDTLPLSSLGLDLEHTGINVSNFNYLFRQISAKLIQVILTIGFFFIIFSKKYNQKLIPREFILFSLGSLIFIFSIIILPILSIEYGLLRAFQQGLIFLSVFIVIGSLAPTWFLGSKIQNTFVGFLAILFLVSNTGVLTQLFGGYYTQLNLNNSGKYFNNYYVHTSEITSLDWLTNEAARGAGPYHTEIQADNYGSRKITGLSNLFSDATIVPGLIRRDSYVYLGYNNMHNLQASILADGDGIPYEYPIDFLDTNKNLIYNSGDVRIYR